MNIKILISAIVFGLILGAGTAFFRGDITHTITGAPIPTPTPNIIQIETKESAQNLLTTLLALESAASVKTVLSTSVANKVDTETYVRDIANIMGVRNMPDGSFSIQEVRLYEENTFASVVVTFTYTQAESVQRNINMLKTDAWRIDSITIPS